MKNRVALHSNIWEFLLKRKKNPPLLENAQQRPKVKNNNPQLACIYRACVTKETHTHMHTYTHFPAFLHLPLLSAPIFCLLQRFRSENLDPSSPTHRLSRNWDVPPSWMEFKTAMSGGQRTDGWTERWTNEILEGAHFLSFRFFLCFLSSFFPSLAPVYFSYDNDFDHYPA